MGGGEGQDWDPIAAFAGLFWSGTTTTLHKQASHPTKQASILSTAPSLADRVYQVNLGPSYSLAASSFRSFK